MVNRSLAYTTTDVRDVGMRVSLTPRTTRVSTAVLRNRHNMSVIIGGVSYFVLGVGLAVNVLTKNRTLVMSNRMKAMVTGLKCPAQMFR